MLAREALRPLCRNVLWKGERVRVSRSGDPAEGSSDLISPFFSPLVPLAASSIIVKIEDLPPSNHLRTPVVMSGDVRKGKSQSWLRCCWGG